MLSIQRSRAHILLWCLVILAVVALGLQSLSEQLWVAEKLIHARSGARAELQLLTRELDHIYDRVSASAVVENIPLWCSEPEHLLNLISQGTDLTLHGEINCPRAGVLYLDLSLTNKRTLLERWVFNDK